MRTQAQLCHIEATRCVVLVSVSDGSTVIASALGEASRVEDAEDRARERLRQRLEPGNAVTTPQESASPSPTRPRSKQPARAETGVEPATPAQHSALPSSPPASSPAIAVKAGSGEQTEQPTDPAPAPLDLPLLQTPEPLQAEQAPSETPTDPDDWSDELAAIDLELQRIGWDRAQERNYLERAFGHGSRHKVTRYSDLVAYIKRLQDLEPGTSADEAPVPLRRSELISQGDQMLQSLRWEPAQARAFLQEQLGASSRQSLSDEQLLAFNIMLENEIVKLGHTPLSTK